METGQGDLDPFTDLLKWEFKLISQVPQSTEGLLATIQVLKVFMIKLFFVSIQQTIVQA